MTIGRSGDILPHGSHHHDKQHTDESGVARLNREAGGTGAVPPLCQRANLQKTSLGEFGKAQRSDELEPGELPDRRSPSDLRVTGRGSVSCAGRSASLRRRFGGDFMRCDAASVAGNAFSKRGLWRRTHIFDGVKT